LTWSEHTHCNGLQKVSAPLQASSRMPQVVANDQ
jgi:hypothetical protein